jgi:transposase-like protein
MNNRKVVTREEIINRESDSEIFGPIKEKIVSVVLDVLGGLKDSLEKELSGIGLLVMDAVMELEVTKVAGVKGKHQKQRQYNWWGTNPGSVILDGKRVKRLIPRAVEAETQKAYRLKSYGLFRQAGDLVRKAYQDLIRGVSTRQYREGVSQFLDGYGMSAASVSRRMIKATAEKVKDLMKRSLKDLQLVVLMIDGVKVGDHTVVLSLGIDREGVKHVLGLWQGSTENSRVATSLLSDLRERGLDLERPLLVVIDGSKALRKAINDVLGTDTVVQRCMVHKKRNVLEELPKQHRRQVSLRMNRAYAMTSADDAYKELERLANELEKINPSAARSLREGLDETLTLHRLSVPETLRKSLQSTNIAESAISGVRQRARNVKRWPDEGRRSPKAHQIERWTGAGILEVEKKFRRIKGYGAMQILINALAAERDKRERAA